MKNSEKKWFQPGSWELLLADNQTFCQTQKLDTKHCPKNFDKTRQLWESQCGKVMSLPEALDFCRKCHSMGPFIFNNGNTFATFAKKLVEAWANAITPVEAQMLRTTIGHYVTGQASRKEMIHVLEFLGPSWEKLQATAAPVRQETAKPVLQAVPGQQFVTS